MSICAASTILAAPLSLAQAAPMGDWKALTIAIVMTIAIVVVSIMSSKRGHQD